MALDLLRSTAQGLADQADKDALWSLVPVIGESGAPSWEEVVVARTVANFLALAHRGEHHVETGARLARDAQRSELRTCSASVDDYLAFRESKKFSPAGNTSPRSTLRRMLAIRDADGVLYAERRVASIASSDEATRILDALGVSDRLSKRGRKRKTNTEAKQRKELVAWFNRRLFEDEIQRIMDNCDVQCRCAFTVTHRLGLRIGELIHLRFLLDVKPIEGGHGYEVVLEGQRGADARCSCDRCKDEQGWGVKNGPRRYILDRRLDRIGWIGVACDALDQWIAIRRPARGDFLFSSYQNRAKAWTSQDIGKRFRAAATAARVEVGQYSRGGRTFHSLRHACGSEMLERRVPHALVAQWIGDTLDEFMKTYGRPDPRLIAAATLGGTLELGVTLQP